MLHGIVVAAHLVLTVSTSANDAEFEMNGWRGGPTFADDRFERCEMRFGDDGNQLVVALTEQGDVGVGLRQTESLRGEQAMLAYRTDESTMARAPAQDIADGVIAWFDGPDYARHLVGIVRSERVTLELNGQTTTFGLQPGEAPADALVECVQHYLDRQNARAGNLIETFRLR